MYRFIHSAILLQSMVRYQCLHSSNKPIGYPRWHLFAEELYLLNQPVCPWTSFLQTYWVLKWIDLRENHLYWQLVGQVSFPWVQYLSLRRQLMFRIPTRFLLVVCALLNVSSKVPTERKKWYTRSHRERYSVWVQQSDSKTVCWNILSAQNIPASSCSYSLLLSHMLHSSAASPHHQ